MYLGIDGKYSQFEELMHYYHIQFTVYYLLVAIVLVNSIKSAINYINVKKGKKSNITSNSIDLLVSMLSGMGLASGMFFQGVFADMAANYFNIWGNKMLALCVAALVLFVVQVTFNIKIESANKAG